MKKCIVIMQPSVYDLEQSANKMLNNGWVPLGGIAISPDATSAFSRCYLAMMHENYVDKDEETREDTVLDVLSGLIDLINDALDEHGDIGAVFTPEYQDVYVKACRLLNRNPHEMLR
jgi:hypothetical protein